MDSQLIMWIVLAAALGVLELLTMAFVSLYFAVGAMVAGVIAWLDGPLWLQLLGFAASGFVLMLVTRPLLKRKLEAPDIPTNVDRMVGKRGIVTIAIDNDANTGQIRVGSEYWTARWPEATPGTVIPVEARVEILAIEGVTARVMPVETT